MTGLKEIERVSNMKCDKCGRIVRPNSGYYYERANLTRVEYYCRADNHTFTINYDYKIKEFMEYNIIK